MTTAYTSLLGLALPVTGELSGTWGDTVNTAITTLLDSAIAGTTTLSTDADVTLTTTTGAANTSRQAILLCSGARTVLRTITAPAQSKIYTVINSTTGGFSVKIVGVGPTTGVTIVAGESALIAWNGSDFTKISNTGGSASFTNVTVTGTTTLSGLTASTALALDASKNVVSVTNTGTGSNVLAVSPTLTGTIAGASLSLSSLTSGRVTFATTAGLLQDSANLTFDGTNLTLLGGTANGVTFLNGSKVLTSGSALTFDGTNLFVNGTTQIAGAKLNVRGTGSYIGVGGTVEMLFGDNGASEGFLGTFTNHPVTFRINNTERMRIDSSGNVGIGTSSPANKLVVSNAGAAGFEFDPTNGIMQTYNRSGAAYTATNILASSINFKTGASPATVATIDSSGNVGIGTSSPSSSNGNVSKVFQVSGTGNSSTVIGASTAGTSVDNAGVFEVRALAQTAGNDRIGQIYFGRENTSTTALSGYMGFGTTSSGTFAERARIDSSGNLLVGRTSAVGKVDIESAKGTQLYINQLTGGSQFALFHFNGAIVGSISTNGVTTSYNVSSDYRLKENIQNADSTSSLIDSLQVRKFDWKSNGLHQRYGFVAQELVTVVPEAVHQPADPEQMMAVDYSKLVPMLVKEIQLLRKRLADAGI